MKIRMQIIKTLFLLVFGFYDAALLYSQQSGNVPRERQEPSGSISETAYVIGPEDVIAIHVWREDALSRTIPVRMDGKISLPLLDDVQAAGYTPHQLKDILTERLKTFIDNPSVSVIVVEANSFKVYVSGQVRTPGMVQLRRETTLLQLIPLVGGFTEWADKKNVMIIRKESGKERKITVDCRKLMKGEDLNSNILLRPGDMIIVP